MFINGGALVATAPFTNSNGDPQNFNGLPAGAFGGTFLNTIVRTAGPTTNGYTTYQNGALNGAKTLTPPLTSAVARTTLGGRDQGSPQGRITGDIAEVILYTNTNASSDEQQKIQSYLALKYGITLVTDYLDSNASVVWDRTINTNYNNNIAGLSRDDDSELHQKVSKSVNAIANLTISTINDFTLPNSDSSRTALTNGQFLIWGSDFGGMTTQTTESPIGTIRVQREWLVQNTGSVGAVNLQFDNLPSLAAGQQYLLYKKDSNSNFSAGATLLQASNNNTFLNVDINGGASATYLMVAISMTPTAVEIDGNSSDSVDENAAIGTDIGVLTSVDGNLPNDSHSYSFACTNAGADDGSFSISGTSLKTAVVFDHESPNNKTYNICVRTTDSFNLFFDQNLTITINDLNEAPSIADATFSVLENSANSTSVGTPTSSDPEGNTLAYSITGGNTGGVFAISSTTGEITVANGSLLDNETIPSYSLAVQVTDGQTPALIDTATITINVTDLNEAPSIVDATFSVLENSANSTSVGTPTSSDPEGNTLAYGITGGNTSGVFAISSTTGEITVANGSLLDNETIPSYSLAVQVTDGQTPALTDTATITINVTDVNEAPSIADTIYSIPDSAITNTVVGTPASSDPDTGATLGYSITAGNNDGVFAINALTGEISIADGSQLDANTTSSYSLTVQVDDGTLTDTATITINITDDTPPTISINTISGDDIINAEENNNIVVINGSSIGAELGQTVTVSINSISYTTFVAAGGSWSIDMPAADAQALTDGIHQVTADVSDQAGNAAVQATRNVTASSSIPAISINIIASDDIINATEDDSDITVTGTALGSLGPGSVIGQTATIVINSVTYTSTVLDNGSTTDPNDGTWSIILTAAQAQALLENTDYTVTANISNQVGSAADEAARTITHDVTAPATAPTVTAQTTSDTTPTISGTATVVSGDTFSVEINGITYTAGDGHLSIKPNGSWELTLPASDVLGEGTYSVIATVTDAAGNQTIDSTNNELIIDTAGPSVAIATPPAATTSNEAAYPVSGTCSVGDGVVTVGIVGATPASQTVACSAAGTWTATFDVSAIADGTAAITVTASQTDGANNTDTATATATATKVSANFPVTPIPLMTAWGLAGLSGLMALLGIGFSRRRV